MKNNNNISCVMQYCGVNTGSTKNKKISKIKLSNKKSQKTPRIIRKQLVSKYY